MSIKEVIATQDFVFAPSTSQPRKLNLNQDGSVSDSTGQVAVWQMIMGSSPSIVLYDTKNSFVARVQWNGGTMFQGRDMTGPAELRPSRPLEIKNNVSVVRNVRLHGEVSQPKNTVKPAQDLNYFLNPIAPKETTAIVLIACNRPNYFKQVVDALAPQVQDKPVYLFIDRPIEEGQLPVVEEQRKYVEEKFKLLSVIIRPRNFGCGMNIVDARDKIFGIHDRAFILEDDMVPDANYIEYCEKLWDWSRQFSNVGAVQGWAHCTMTPAQKKRNNKIVRATFENAWGYLMDAKTWSSIRTSMLDYSTFIKDVPYMNRDNLRISRFMRIYKDKPFEPHGNNPVLLDQLAQNDERSFLDNCPTCQDGMTYLALRNAGLVRLAPVVNRGIYIGKSGIHSTPEMYNKARLGEVVSSNLKVPESFELRGQK